MPVFWGKNQKGMQARVELSDVLDTDTLTAEGYPIEEIGSDESPKDAAKRVWLQARDDAISHSKLLAKLGVHKQICNRIIEPWMPYTALVSATEFENWFKLRAHPDAQPEIQELAYKMLDIYNAYVPAFRKPGEWHLPLIFPEDDELTLEQKKKVSAARCARVSYLTHDGRRDIEADLRLHDRLVVREDSDEPIHASPTEHVAMALSEPIRSGNFVGWRQYRKEIESDIRKRMGALDRSVKKDVV